MLRWSPPPLDHNEIPEICRKELVEWHRVIGDLGELLLGLMSEGLGFHADKFKEDSLLGERMMVGHYYPYCPQPDLTIGFTSHADPGGLTVLLVQDQSGKLQVKYDEGWVVLKPLPGALIINIGDFLQVITNEEYKSVDHRVFS
ncbi:hypothetical protein L6164_001499 [Bauhinia variegata]|uniref:Uncharacterized protein n=1 Tax=Bauhinia variegata TaxID=167791 RepID=A0ACB9QBY4_BAUVA|nr:hypothetical protein L6164_001499 [Bauhinia variegata]